MTPALLRSALDVLGMSQRGLADALAWDERQVRRWFQGAPVPPDVVAWLSLALAELAPLVAAADAWHEENPPPRRKPLNPF